MSPGSRPGDGGGVCLYITYDGLLEPLGASQVIPYVAGLADRLPWTLHVLSFEKPGDLGAGDRGEAMASRLASRGVAWTPLRYHARPSLPATAWDVAMGVARGRRILAAGRPCLVHARSYVAGFMALRLKRGTGVPLLFDMRGFWVDERIEGGIWPAGHPVVPVARRVERALLRGSDAVVSLTEAGRLVLAQGDPPVDPERVRVIPTCVDLERFRPGASADADRGAGGPLPGPVLVHSGSLSTWYLGDLTFRVGRAWVERSGGSFLVLTRETALARELAARHGVDARIESVTHDEVPGRLAACDAGLSLVRPVPSKRASAPTKVGEYLACGLAVGATGVGDLPEQLAGSRVAVAVAQDDDPGAVAAELLACAARAGRVGEARALAEATFGLEAGVETYADLYRELAACG